MVYNMSIEKEENNRPFKPQIHPREVEDKTDRILVIEIDHLVGTDKDKTSDLTIGDNQKIGIYNMDKTVGEEVTDAKIITEMTVEIEGDKTLGEASVMIEADQEKEA